MEIDEITKQEVREMLDYVRNNLNESLSNYNEIVNYLVSNYDISKSLAIFYLNVIQSEWER